MAVVISALISAADAVPVAASKAARNMIMRMTAPVG
jgi:hypothetical protein